ncbi:MAG: hypothetical protein EAZ55_13195 [Cytophagales bacterium]|nr:MAG: hypothetical protein EAZ55_13195 [Cytophagales bacterium]
MFIPPAKYIDQLREQNNENIPKVYLKNDHIILHKTIADALFGESPFVYIAYQVAIKKLFIVSYTDEVFKKLHQPAMQMLKQRGENPEKSISIRETLIDNEIPNEDRTLEYEIREKRKMLVINL